MACLQHYSLRTLVRPVQPVRNRTDQDANVEVTVVETLAWHHIHTGCGTIDLETSSARVVEYATEGLFGMRNTYCTLEVHSARTQTEGTMSVVDANTQESIARLRTLFLIPLACETDDGTRKTTRWDVICHRLRYRDVSAHIWPHTRESNRNEGTLTELLERDHDILGDG